MMTSSFVITEAIWTKCDFDVIFRKWFVPTIMAYFDDY